VLAHDLGKFWRSAARSAPETETDPLDGMRRVVVTVASVVHRLSGERLRLERSSAVAAAAGAAGPRWLLLFQLLRATRAGEIISAPRRQYRE